MTKDSPTLFVGLAKVQTMLRDFDRLRQSIRKHGTEEQQDALDKCERWFSFIDPTAKDRADALEQELRALKQSISQSKRNQE